MENKISIIVGGSGQIGICLAKLLLKKKHKIIITTRNIISSKKKIPFKSKKLNLLKLDVLKKKQVNSLLKKFKPQNIFYFAGQSSPNLSFRKKKITHLSNVIGCKNFLEIIYKQKLDTKFINASSSEIFADTSKKIMIESKKKPISPYGKSKLESFNITKFYREKKNLRSYNAIIFNTESYYRNRNYLIPKICIAAINAKIYNKKTFFGNLNVFREWNWGDEQVIYMMKFISKKPQDFILSNGHSFSAKKMLSFAFQYFDLDYKLYTQTDKNFIRKKDFLVKRSNFIPCLKRNNMQRISKVFGKKLIHLLIKHYLNEKKN
jgi:GDPmannose 4,6-dehydratase